MSAPFYGYGPDDGLHVLKDVWCQKKYFGLQSRALVEPGRLGKSIAATFEAAPVRKQGFRLNRSPTQAIHESEQERRLEAALMQRWGRAGMWSVPNGWDRLIASQVPLFDQQLKQGWGYIDLLGMGIDGRPVVVELKKAPGVLIDGKTSSTETPLRIVLEGAAYAIALRKNWDQFRPEWISKLKELEVPDRVISKVPQSLSRVPLVAAAPASYWIDWLPVTPKGREVSDESWVSFQQLLSELRREELPVAFVSIAGHDLVTDSLAIQPLDHFPPIQSGQSGR